MGDTSGLVDLVTEESAVGARVKPKLRGWLHALMLPLAFFAGGLLVGTSSTQDARIASAVFATTSALLHRGSWSPPVEDVLRRIDHANPSPTFFGFHEVFHAFTVAAFASHYIAVWVVAHA